QKKSDMMKNEETSFNVDSTQASPFSRCLQPLSPVTKLHRATAFGEEFRPHLSHFRYGPPPLGEMETFQGSLEGGSRKRKSMPTKMPPSIALEGSSSPPDRPEDHNDIGSSSLPLVFQQPAQPKYSSQMIDLCNFGFQPHKCQVCHKAFTQTSHLKRHMMQHSDIKPYNCRICGRGFAYPSELKAHKSKHESGRENICVECGLDFPTLAQLKRHLTTHRGPIQYNCTECDKTFQYPSQLQNHMMKHKDIRPYICTECGMEFVQPHHLKQHSLTHKGVKEHKCGICGREFTLLANMKRHVLIHTNIRAYQCHLCFKSFVQKQTLKAHMIVHSDVKPFKCKLCGKEFNRMHNLMGHMHLHSDSKPFKCLYCPSKFTLKGNLTRHMKVKHGVMERGFHSPGFGRGRIALSQTSVLRSLEQEEPFDLSQKSQGKGILFHSDGKGISFHLDGESAKGSSCQEEEEDNCYEPERYSPAMYHHNDNKLYVAKDLSGKPECMMKDFRESYCNEKEEVLSEGGLEKRIGNSDKQESQGERDLAKNKEHFSFISFEKARLGHSLSDYLYFKHRNKSLKELLERKMEKQTMLIGI
ncbi:ZN366 protein, partial [Ciconia maguari]|nr:ZN366 protein [Ciconia maguari]